MNGKKNKHCFKQDYFRSIRFYFLPFTAPSFFGCAQNVARSCSCGDQAVTHTHTHTTRHGTHTHIHTQEDYYNPPPTCSG